MGASRRMIYSLMIKDRCDAPKMTTVLKNQANCINRLPLPIALLARNVAGARLAVIARVINITVRAGIHPDPGQEVAPIEMIAPIGIAAITAAGIRGRHLDREINTTVEQVNGKIKMKTRTAVLGDAMMKVAQKRIPRMAIAGETNHVQARRHRDSTTNSCLRWATTY